MALMDFCSGQRTGFSLMRPCNLPKATRLPVKLTEPKTIPKSLGKAGPSAPLIHSPSEEGNHLRHGGHFDALGQQPARDGADDDGDDDDAKVAHVRQEEGAEQGEGHADAGDEIAGAGGAGGA